MRTKLDIDDPILRDLKRPPQREGKPLGWFVSDLPAQAPAAQRAGQDASVTFRGATQAMGLHIDPCGKDTARGVLDGRPAGGSRSPAPRWC